MMTWPITNIWIKQEQLQKESCLTFAEVCVAGREEMMD